uniref:Uncharacterized protein n=1 Tax=Strigamia maritima TaxID=126957 RepID=T1J189_STRMM
MFLPILLLTCVIALSNGIYYLPTSQQTQRKSGNWPQQSSQFIPSYYNWCHQNRRPAPCSNSPRNLYPNYPPLYVINSAPCLCDCGSFESKPSRPPTETETTTVPYVPPVVRPEYFTDTD